MKTPWKSQLFLTARAALGASALAVIACLIPAGSPLCAQDPPVPEFLRGDSNTDGEISISDVLHVRRFLFNGDRPPTCLSAADANDDGMLDLSDAIMMVYFVFFAPLTPPPPYPTAGPDPTPDGLGCEAYEVQPPQETGDVLRIGDVEAQPGKPVLIPVHVTSAHEIEAFQLVVRYDPSVFIPETELIQPHERWQDIIAGSVNEELYTALYGGAAGKADCFHFFYKIDAYAGNAVFVAGFIPSFLCTGYEIPPGDDVLAFNILGTVSEDALPGTPITLEPTNGPGDLGFGRDRLRNELTYRGDARYISVVPKTVFGILQVVPEIAVFIRGDTNSDGTADLSDAISTLGYLFLGDPEPPCLDAADADDDGVLLVTDPIAALMFLFLGGPALPPPSGIAGEDPTPDALDCRRGLDS